MCSKILEEAGAIFTDVDSADELDTYIAEPLVSFERDNCFTWWVNLSIYMYSSTSSNYVGVAPIMGSWPYIILCTCIHVVCIIVYLLFRER